MPSPAHPLPAGRVESGRLPTITLLSAEDSTMPQPAAICSFRPCNRCRPTLAGSARAR